jgi:MoaA/NifB/PqqE/SkfB family radical SAM enzyme
MYHSEIKRRIRREGLLLGAMLELTYRCNFDCFFCYNDRQAPGTALSVEQYLRLFDELAAMNVLFLTFTGGEPLVHPEFFSLGRAARERGFSIRVKSNGHMLREDVARRLKTELNPIQVEMSLHGACAATHERQTRVPGSFARLIDNIPLMRELQLRPALVSTLTAWNEHESEAMFALADSLGVTLRFQGPVGPRDDGDTAPLAIQPSAEGWRRFLEIAKRRSGGEANPGEAAVLGANTAPDEETYCGAGSEEILVDPFGNVIPCLHLRRSAGNLHDAPLQTIWRHSRIFAEARELSAHTMQRIRRDGPLSTLGAPLFCPGMEKKGCATCSGSEFPPTRQAFA